MLFCVLANLSRRNSVIRLLAFVAVLLTAVLALPLRGGRTSAQSPLGTIKISQADHYIFYRGPNGEFACREATLFEAYELDLIRPTGLRQITHQTPEIYLKSDKASADNVEHLKIILRGTAELEKNPAAKAAFQRAAAIWEAQIKSPITIYIDVDFGDKNF